ncbi:RING-type domain-containing protein [Plasmodiophora brassicae]
MPVLVRETDDYFANLAFDNAICLRGVMMVISAAQIAYMTVEMLGFEVSPTAVALAVIPALVVLSVIRPFAVVNLVVTIAVLATYAPVQHAFRRAPTPSWLPIAIIFAVWRCVELAIQLFIRRVSAEARDRDNAIGVARDASAERRIAERAPPLTTFADLSGTRPDHQCPICITTFDGASTVRHLPCDHTFHAACLDPWMKTHADARCPVCRRAIFQGA